MILITSCLILTICGIQEHHYPTVYIFDLRGGQEDHIRF